MKADELTSEFTLMRIADNFLTNFLDFPQPTCGFPFWFYFSSHVSISSPIQPMWLVRARFYPYRNPIYTNYTGYASCIESYLVP